jgi:hypothetical protein
MGVVLLHHMFFLGFGLLPFTFLGLRIVPIGLSFGSEVLHPFFLNNLN